MTLEETIEYIKNLCIERSEDIECNECRTKHSDVLAYLLELHAWREDPFTQLKEHCEAMDKCIECDWLERGCPNCFVTTPEDWKL
jgi:hypothetical protein